MHTLQYQGTCALSHVSIAPRLRLGSHIITGHILATNSYKRQMNSLMKYNMLIGAIALRAPIIVYVYVHKLSSYFNYIHDHYCFLF